MASAPRARAAQAQPRAPRSMPPPPAPLRQDDDDDEPDVPDVIVLTTSKSRKAGKRVVVFSIDGKDYSVPENPPAGILLSYVDAIRQHGAGSGAAEAVMLDLMLGTEGYAALRSYPDLTLKDLARVITKVTGILNGPMETPKD
jgi:hypothetical protein